MSVPPAPAAGSPVMSLSGFTHRYADVNGTRIHYSQAEAQVLDACGRAGVAGSETT